jgi:hypothetical protein
MATDTSEPFTKMAERVKHNADSTFGGAVVMVPPGDSKPIELLMLDAGADEGQFWATVLTRIQTAMAETDAKKRLGSSYGLR